MEKKKPSLLLHVTPVKWSYKSYQCTSKRWPPPTPPTGQDWVRPHKHYLQRGWPRWLKELWFVGIHSDRFQLALEKHQHAVHDAHDEMRGLAQLSDGGDVRWFDGVESGFRLLQSRFRRQQLGLCHNFVGVDLVHNLLGFVLHLLHLGLHLLCSGCLGGYNLQHLLSLLRGYRQLLLLDSQFFAQLFHGGGCLNQLLQTCNTQGFRLPAIAALQPVGAVIMLDIFQTGCAVCEMARVVCGNWLDNRWNWSDTWSPLLLQYQCCASKHKLPSHLTHTHMPQARSHCDAFVVVL